MLSVVASWAILLLYSYITGMVVLNTLYKREPGIDECIWTGTVAITVYAQVFSLFYRVGLMAFTVLSFLMCLLLIYSARNNKNIYKSHIEQVKKLSQLQWFIILIILIAMISWTNTTPELFDTYLYHDQSIQWLERYGVVRGLGNLHCRFAYNSSFLPLQALFSFRGIIGQSLHTVNGFLAAFMLIYCFSTHALMIHKSVGLSDHLRLALIGYICYAIPYISSPGTDIPALILFLYICIKWNDKEDAFPDRYAWLCMLAIFDVTLKLSAVTCVTLIVYPMIVYLKEKRASDIIKHIITGFLILAPWLVRNVIISGYLVYPYAKIDFFNFDWKMPASVAISDSREIQGFARGYTDITRDHIHISEWFPAKWFAAYTGWFDRCCMIFGIIAFIFLTVFILRELSKKAFKPILYTFYAMILISFIIWFTNAPSIRFGVVFCFALFAIWTDILSKSKTKTAICGSRIIMSVSYIYVALMLVHVTGNWTTLPGQPPFLQKDYSDHETSEIQYDGFTVWYPNNESGLCGCRVFPSVPYPKIVEHLEMRGNDIKSGFRISDEYRNKVFDMSGNILDSDS